MIRRIVLENFMSHGRTVIEPSPGLTVLWGPNNCGKSAVVVALKTLCSNARGDFMVRHGSAECRVSVETDDGHSVEWRRRGDVVSYRLDGRDVHRVGGGVPDGLHEILRLSEVETPDGAESFDIHFAEQKRPIFLLDRPGRQAALFFASSSDAALLVEMQRRHRQRIIERKREEEDLGRRIEERARSIRCLEPVETVQASLERVEEERDALEEALAQEERLQRLAEDLRRAAVAGERARRRVEVLEGLPRPPSLEPEEPLERLLEPLDRAGREAGRLEERAAVLRDLPAPPVLKDPAPLEGAIAGLAAAGAALGERAASAKDIEERLGKAEEDLRRWARENPLCPTCGAPVDPERLLSARGMHLHGPS